MFNCDDYVLVELLFSLFANWVSLVYDIKFYFNLILCEFYWLKQFLGSFCFSIELR